jgi:uncharacterized protein YbjT (DUF2867 family)
MIAGGTGFLGRHVAAALVATGHTVLLLARGTRTVRAADGMELLRTDVGSDALPLEAMRGCAALVNLIGIKREEGTQTFERVHVEVPRHLIEAAQELGIRRYVHISVVCSRSDPSSAYHDTKWRAEELIRASGLDYDVVGPERLSLRAVVETVARGLGLPLRVVGTPIWFQRVAVGLMNALCLHPLSTPAQLQMLIDGLYGDPAATRAELGVEPRPFIMEEVRRLAGSIPSLFGVSLRHVGRSEQAAW